MHTTDPMQLLTESSFELRIHFLSDWHIGEGAGRSGQIDRIVKRHPQDELPYVPAKTLTGMLRDACEKIALGLDESQPGGLWQQLCDRLFGDARHPALLSIGAARFAPALRQVLLEHSDVPQALFFVKPGVALDEHGMAREDHLRMEECVMAGAALRAKIELQLQPEDPRTPAAQALLWAGARVLDRMGAKRRRGHGRCNCELRLVNGQSLPAEDLLQRLQTTPPPATVKPEPVVQPGSPPVGTPEGPQDWCCHTLELQLLTPVVVPARTLGNVVESRDHIPGTLLLSALSRQLGTQLGPQWHSLLAAGDIQIRHAYLAPAGQRLLPVPMAIFETKQKPATQPDLNLIRCDPPAGDTTQRKQCRTGYVSGEADTSGKPPHMAIGRVQMQSATHATIDDLLQRPTESTGGVYTYEAMAAGQTLHAELWIRQPWDRHIQWQTLAGPIRLGRSKKDDYGKAHLRVQQRQPPLSVAPAPDGQDFTLWLVSPLLLRNERLQPSTEVRVLQEHLQRTLGVSAVRIERFQRRVHREDGWQTAWHTHRPSRVGFAAGSCFLVQVDAADASWRERLTALQNRGLGERRAEGYGEIRIEAPLLSLQQLAVGTLDAPAPVVDHADAAPLSEAETGFLDAVLKRHWHKTLVQHIRQKVRDPQWRRDLLGHQASEPSQLGNLRAYLETATGHQGQELFKQWMQHALVKETDKATKGQGQVPPSFAAVRALYQDPQQIWQRIDSPRMPERDAPGRSQRYRTELATEALRLTLLAAVHQAHASATPQTDTQGR